MKLPASLTQFFLWSAGALLLAAALERFLLATGSSQILALPDAVLGIPVRTALLLVGALELLVALVCLLGKSPGTPATLLTWLLLSGAAYRVGLVYLGCSVRCTCLGRFADPLRLAGGGLADLVAVLPGFLLAGAGGVLVLTLRRQQTQDRTFLKVACPGCGGHIQFPAAGVDLKITCPHCGGGIRPQKLSPIT